MSVRGTLARLGVLALGVWVGVVGTVVHRMSADVADVTVPWGLALALVTVLVTAWACERAVRVGAAWFGFGWTLVLLAQQVRSSTSYLVAADTLGWAWTFGGLGMCAAVVALVPRLGR